jgi:hypothetical protein
MKIMMLLCFLLLNSCSSFHKVDTPILIDKQSHFYLQPVPEKLWGQASLQKLKVTTPQDKHELLLQTELLPNQINMVGLSNAGLVLFKLTWSKELGMKISTNILTKDINAQVMLAYYQLANWPIRDIQVGLQDLRIAYSPENNQKRDFFRGSEIVFSVTHDAKHSVMTHYLDQYQIQIETINQNIIDY